MSYHANNGDINLQISPIHCVGAERKTSFFFALEMPQWDYHSAVEKMDLLTLFFKVNLTGSFFLELLSEKLHSCVINSMSTT